MIILQRVSYQHHTLIGRVSNGSNLVSASAAAVLTAVLGGYLGIKIHQILTGTISAANAVSETVNAAG